MEKVATTAIKPLLARTVARALTKHLEAAGTSVHWVSVIGEDSLKVTPEVTWPDTDPLLNLMLSQGHSEGYLVYVMAQNDRYKPEGSTPLLRIKMLGGLKEVLAEMALMWEFLYRVETLRVPSVEAEQASV